MPGTFYIAAGATGQMVGTTAADACDAASRALDQANAITGAVAAKSTLAQVVAWTPGAGSVLQAYYQLASAGAETNLAVLRRESQGRLTSAYDALDQLAGVAGSYGTDECPSGIVDAVRAHCTVVAQEAEAVGYVLAYSERAKVELQTTVEDPQNYLDVPADLFKNLPNVFPSWLKWTVVTVGIVAAVVLLVLLGLYIRAKVKGP
jgi:hypothetical protein